MKSNRFTLIAGSALACTSMAFAGCSSGADSSAPQTTDQVDSALHSMKPIECKINPITCQKALRQCVESSCASEVKDLLSARPFSPEQVKAVFALQQCALTSCSTVCEGGAGGASGAGGTPSAGGATASGGTAGAPATGGAPSAGGAPADGGVATGGAPAAGGAVSTGGAPSAGGAVSTGGTTGDAGPPSTGGCGGTSAGGSTSTGGATSTGGSVSTGGAPETGGTPATGGSSGGGVDLSGTWISRVQTAGTISAPVVGSTAANIDIVLRLLVSQSASTLTGTFQICRLNTVTTPNASSLVVTFTPAVLNTLVTTATEPAFAAAIGQPVPLPAITIRTGIDASGNSVDSDMDGHPGVTIPSNVGGILQLNAYTGLTIQNTLTSKLTDAMTITGTTSFSTTGVVFGSDNAALTSGNINVTPSSSSIPFTATKLAGDVPCSTVLNSFP